MVITQLQPSSLQLAGENDPSTVQDLEAEKSLVFSVSLAEKTLLKGTILLSSTSFDDKNPTSVGCILQCMEKTPSFYERFTFWDDCDMNVCLKIEIKRWLIHGISTLLRQKLQLTRFFDGFRGNESKKQERSTPCCFHIAAPITTGLECANESEDACYDL